MTLKAYGANGYRKLLSQNIRCAEYLDQLVRESDDFEPFHHPNLFIYSFRYLLAKYKIETQENPDLLDEINKKLDRMNQTIADEIQLSGTAFVMTTRLRGLTVLRLSICSHRTTPEDIDLVFNTIREIGQKAELAEFNEYQTNSKAED